MFKGNKYILFKKGGNTLFNLVNEPLVVKGVNHKAKNTAMRKQMSFIGHNSKSANAVKI